MPVVLVRNGANPGPGEEGQARMHRQANPPDNRAYAQVPKEYPHMAHIQADDSRRVKGNPSFNPPDNEAGRSKPRSRPIAKPEISKPVSRTVKSRSPKVAPGSDKRSPKPAKPDIRSKRLVPIRPKPASRSVDKQPTLAVNAPVSEPDIDSAINKELKELKDMKTRYDNNSTSAPKFQITLKINQKDDGNVFNENLHGEPTRAEITAKTNNMTENELINRFMAQTEEMLHERRNDYDYELITRLRNSSVDEAYLQKIKNIMEFFKEPVRYRPVERRVHGKASDRGPSDGKPSAHKNPKKIKARDQPSGYSRTKPMKPKSTEHAAPKRSYEKRARKPKTTSKLPGCRSASREKELPGARQKYADKLTKTSPHTKRKAGFTSFSRPVDRIAQTSSQLKRDVSPDEAYIDDRYLFL